MLQRGEPRLPSLRLALLPALVLLFCQALYCPLTPRSLLDSGRFVDDAFYYMQVARHAAAGQGFSVDGINATNGFQPLWAWLLVPVSRLAPEPRAALPLVFALQVLLLAAGLSFAGRGLLRLKPRAAPAWPAVLPLAMLAAWPGFSHPSLLGLETALLLCLLGLLFQALARPGAGEGLASALGLGLLAGLACLARVDALLLAGLILLHLLQLPGRRGPRLLAYCLPLLALALPWLIHNRLAFGHWMPISGVAKHLYSQWALQNDQARTGLPFWRLRLANLAWPLAQGEPMIFIAWGLGLLAAALAWRRAPSALQLVLASVLLLYPAYALAQYDQADFNWYYMPLYLALGLAAGWAWPRLWLAGARARWASAGLGLALGLALLPGLWRDIQWKRAARAAEQAGAPALTPQGLMMEAARALGSRLPMGMVLSSHNSGIPGYFFRQAVVNLDGLASGPERLASLERDHNDVVPYLLAHPRIQGYCDLIRHDATARVDAVMARAGLRPLDLARLGGPWQDAQGQVRLYLRLAPSPPSR